MFFMLKLNSIIKKGIQFVNWKKIIIFIALLVSNLTFADEPFGTVTIIKKGEDYEKKIIPLFSELSNEEILNKYRPTEKKYEIKGKWDIKNKNYYYSTSNQYQMCKNTGNNNDCLKWGIVKATDKYKKEYGKTIEEVAKGNESGCSGEDSFSVSILNQKDNHFLYGVQSCKNRNDGKENVVKKVSMSIKPVIQNYKISINKNKYYDTTISNIIPEEFYTCEGNPCDAITGNKIETSVDYPHPDFPIVRVYQSNMRYNNTGIGAGWTFNFEVSIKENENNEPKLIQGSKTYSIKDQQIESFPKSLFIKKENEYLVILQNFIYKFNKKGVLLSISDFYKEKVNFEYQNNLVSKINVSNGSFIVERENGQVKKIITPNKKELTYSFDEANVSSGEYNLDTYTLSAFKDVNGNETTYQYESLLLKERSNKNGDTFANWEYNELAQVTESRHGDFDVTTIKYQSSGNKETRLVKTPTHTNKYEIKEGVFYKKNKNQIKSKKETTGFKYEYLSENGYGSNLVTKITNKKTKKETVIEYTNDNEYGYYLEKSISSGENKLVYHYNGFILNKIEAFKGEVLINSIRTEFNSDNLISKSFINEELVEEYTYHEGTTWLKEHKQFENGKVVNVITYNNYNELLQPRNIIINGKETVYSFNKQGQITSIDNEEATIAFTLDGEGNQTTITQTSKENKETTVITQTFDNWNHLETKSYNDYKEVYSYNVDNSIKTQQLFYKGNKIEEKNFQYKEGDLTNITSKNEATFTHYKADKNNGVLHKYTVNNVMSEVFVNDDNQTEYVKVKGSKIFDYKYTEDSTTTITANNVSYTETKTDNSVILQSNEYGKEEYVKNDTIVTVNRNGNIQKEHYSDGKITRVEKEGESDTLYTYPEEGILNIVKGEESLTIKATANGYKQTQKFDGKESIFEVEKNKIVYPSGNIVSYSTDEYNILTGISFNESVVVKDMLFNGGSDYHSFEYGNGIKVTKSFDHLNIAKNTHEGLFEETVSIRNGRINSIEYSKAGEKDNTDYRFKYDYMNQLYTIDKFEEKFINDKKEKNRETLKRSFDKNGNITKSFTGDIYKYKKNSNQIKSETINYDISGNMTLFDNMTLVYGDRNEIKKVYNKKGQLIAEYNYNLKGERAKAFYPLLDITKYFYYDHEGKMIEEEINGEFRSFIYLDWQIIGYNYKGELFFNHYSVENTIKATSDSKKDFTYFDYGFENVDNENFVMYLGQYKDEVTGLYYNYNRDYSHKLKRYIQIDPLKLYDGSNPYIYVGNNHINYFDFYGLMSCNYIVSTHKLDCISNSGKTFYFSKGLHSGRKDYPLKNYSKEERYRNRSYGAPIPEGKYQMYASDFTDKINAYNVLDFRIGLKKDSIIERLTDKIFGRNGFQMHLGTLSMGCINFDAKNENLVDKYYDFYIEFEKDYVKNKKGNVLYVKDYE